MEDLQIFHPTEFVRSLFGDAYMIPNHIDVISMGCSKNLIDSERLLRRLEAKGYTVTHNPEDVEGNMWWSIPADSSPMPKRNPSISSLASPN